MQAGAKRMLIISHDIVGSRMAGTGIRYWELARVLAQKHEVTLIAPQPIDLPPPDVTCGSYQWGDARSLEVWLDTDLVVANGFVLLEHAHLADISQPLALDLYDPVLLENLELWRHREAAAREQQNAKDHALLGRQLAAGDYFMCATERQRDLLMGALMGAGRITHAVTDHDPTLRHLIDVVPFGLSNVPPVHHAPALRNVIHGIGADAAILLWTGGLWDWLDPQTLVEAMPTIVARHPEARLVFLAGQHPGAAQPMRAPAASRKRASELGLLDTHVFFYDQWIPYEQRSSFLLEADIAVSLHHNHLETAYAAVRSRFLDHLWAGLPSVVSDGDAAADLVRSKALGVVVAPGDQAATANAVIELLDDPAQRAQHAENARAVAHDYTWDRVTKPLVDFCDAPRRTRLVVDVAESQPAPAPQPHQGVHATMQHEQARLLKQMEESWQFGTLPTSAGGVERLVHEAVLRVVGPLIAQQREFNAALVKFLYTVHDRQDIEVVLNAVMAQLTAAEREVTTLRQDVHARIDTLSTYLHERIDTLSTDVHGRVDSLSTDTHARLDTIAAFTGELSARLDTLEQDLHGRLDTTVDVIESLRRDTNARLDTLGDFGGELNDRLTRLAYAAQLLDQAVVAGDELDIVLTEKIMALMGPDRSAVTSDESATGAILPARSDAMHQDAGDASATGAAS